jgi:hypothetical protein
VKEQSERMRWRWRVEWHKNCKIIKSECSLEGMLLSLSLRSFSSCTLLFISQLLVRGIFATHRSSFANEGNCSYLIGNVVAAHSICGNIRVSAKFQKDFFPLPFLILLLIFVVVVVVVGEVKKRTNRNEQEKSTPSFDTIERTKKYEKI